MNEYYQSHEFKLRKRKAYSIVFIILIGWILVKIVTPPSKIISPLPDKPNEKQHSKDPEMLAKKISEAVGTSWANYSIVVQDYTSDFHFDISEKEIFTAASVNKVPIIAVLYSMAAKEKVDLDRVITVQASDIQDFGTGSIRYAGAGSTYSIKTLAKLMISESDNTAAYILANHIVGLDTLSVTLKEWGLTQTDIVENKTSNNDIALLFRKIYEEKITNPAYTQEMLSFFKDTEYESRLPRLLPENVTVYHKIGTEMRIFHDAGIVTDGTHTYYIGIFTSDVTDETATDAKMAEISNLVYVFMQ